MKRNERFYVVNCQHFFMPKFGAKTAYRQGYCKVFHEMCTLLDNEDGVCLAQKEWPEEALFKPKPKPVHRDLDEDGYIR